MYWKNNVEAFRYYLVLESGNFITQDNRKMAPALYLLYTYPFMDRLYTCIRRGIIVLLLGKGSPEPQYSDRQWSPRFFYLLTAYRRRHGRKNVIKI